MSDAPAVSLEARSPFELRVHLGDAVSDQSVREALASGDMGFLHSYTTGFRGGWPRRARGGVDHGLHVALPGTATTPTRGR